MKTKQAFKVRAEIIGKSWETKGTTLTADNEEQARLKAINILNLKPEHSINFSKCEVHQSGAKLKTDSYPYGRLRTTAFFSVEQTKNGFRSVFQTIDPKNGRENKPKKSTYYKMILPCTDGNGHLSFCGHNDFNGTEEINIGLHFLNDFFELFEPQEIKNICLSLVGMMQVNAKAQVIYCGTEWEELKPFVVPQIQKVIEISKTGENNFLQCLINSNKLEELKKPNYSPFKVVQYGIKQD